MYGQAEAANVGDVSFAGVMNADCAAGVVLAARVETGCAGGCAAVSG
jgi:hypothetical protein